MEQGFSPNVVKTFAKFRCHLSSSLPSSGSGVAAGSAPSVGVAVSRRPETGVSVATPPPAPAVSVCIPAATHVLPRDT